MSTLGRQVICYDYPLNERVRTLLRLEDMFEKVQFFAAQDTAPTHHSALVTLFDIMEMIGRADLKSDLLQELERKRLAFESLRNRPEVSEHALDKVLEDIRTTIANLHQGVGKIGQHLRENEWLMSIKQRTGIPGGVCEFDLPSYHYWLARNPLLRRDDIRDWLAPMLSIYD
ncbi:MAG: cell division protein ZapD, partial [Burkholderiales bacterium]